MFIVKYSEQDWKHKPVMVFRKEIITLPVPEFDIYTFNSEEEKFDYLGDEINSITDFFDLHKERNRNKYPITNKTKKWLFDELINFPNESLVKIYVNRLILDGYIGFKKIKGKSSDIDFIIKKSNGEHRLIEIKEKDLPKRAKKGFGLDIPRIKDFQKIEHQTGIPYQLIVRQIDNQKDRNLVAWKYVSIKEFVKDCQNDETVLGSTGMRSSNSLNPTLICAYDKFRDL